MRYEYIRSKKLFWLILGICSLLMTGSGCAQKLDLPKLDKKYVSETKAYLDAHGLPPDAYVIEKFKDHDVVFLGEAHYIKHDPVFVQHLIPRLHENGIYVLATEFARREDQHLVDSLLSSREYDERLAREIQFRQYVHFGYQEYVDIYKAAWTLNRGLEPEEKRFRIVAMNNSPDFSFVKTKADQNDDAIKRQVWHGQTEGDWARVILDEVKKGEKVLAYCGMHHAFSKYQQPIVNFDTGEFYRFEDDRTGNHVYRAIGNRVMTIAFHSAWYSTEGEAVSVYPADGYIDALMHELGTDYYPVGFDVTDSPLAGLHGETSMYAYGYDDFTLGMFCDGYIYFKPFPEYEGVTPIIGFVNNENIDRARMQSPNPDRRNAPPEEFFASAMRAANVEWKYRKFK